MRRVHLAPWAILEDRTVTECIGQRWAHQQGTHQVYDHIHESYIQRNFLDDDLGLIHGALQERSAIIYQSAMPSTAIEQETLGPIVLNGTVLPYLAEPCFWRCSRLGRSATGSGHIKTADCTRDFAGFRTVQLG